MTSRNGSSTVLDPLEVALDHRRLPVSYLSSLLRVMQAAVREVARDDDATEESFVQQPQPLLHVAVGTSGEDIVLRFSFVDPFDATPLCELSSRVFRAFLERFIRFLKELPQPGLWGDSVGGPGPRYDSEVSRRMDQVRLELRRFPRARVGHGQRAVLFEEDRMEIG